MVVKGQGTVRVLLTKPHSETELGYKIVCTTIPLLLLYTYRNQKNFGTRQANIFAQVIIFFHT